MPDSCLSPLESRQAALEESFFQSNSVPGSCKHRCQRMASFIQISSCGNNNINNDNASGELEFVQSSPNSVGNGQRHSARQRYAHNSQIMSYSEFVSCLNMYYHNFCNILRFFAPVLRWQLLLAVGELSGFGILR